MNNQLAKKIRKYARKHGLNYKDLKRKVKRDKEFKKHVVGVI